MSHLHMPDGVLPLWLCFLGYLIIAVYLLVFKKYFKNANSKKIALAGVLSALMIVAMSLEIAPIGYHVNLAALTGILLGPVFSVLSIFTTTILLALLGHGGVTVIGLNTTILSVEAVASYFIFTTLKKHITSYKKSTFIAVLSALIISTATMIGTVYIGTGDLNEVVHHHHGEHQETPVEHHEHKEKFDLNKFITAILLLGSIGWITEAAISAFIVDYIAKIKPEILNNDENN